MKKFKYKLAIIIVFISVIPLVFFSYKSYTTSKNLIMDVEMEKMNIFYSDIIISLNNYCDYTKKDLLYLEKVVTSNIVDGDIKKTEESITKDFYDFIEVNERYDQVRILDMDGFERVRINNSNIVRIVPRNELQNKKNRYYFKDTIKLSSDEIYVSKIDLNIEHGMIEVPNKSVVRLAKVISYNGKPRYVLVLNVNMNYIFDSIREKIKNSDFNNTFLLDIHGYYMVHKNKLKEWGGGENLDTGESFNKDYPEISSQVIGNLDDGNLITKSKDYFWKKFALFSSNEDYLILFTEVDNDLFLKDLDDFFKKLIYQVIVLLIVIIFISYYLSKHITEPIYKLVEAVVDIGKGNFDVHFDVDEGSGSEINILAYEIKKMASELNLSYQSIERRVRERTKELEEVNKKIRKLAQNDPLTGIYNRHYFNQYVTTLSESKDTITIVMIDVNDFKYINDNYGHNIGDEILKEIAEMLKKAVRDTDFVVRYGGDEFLVVLYNADEAVASSFVNRIRLLLFEFNYANDLIDHKLEISVGYDVYDGTRHLLEVINSADEKMYKNKIEIKRQRGDKID